MTQRIAKAARCSALVAAEIAQRAESWSDRAAGAEARESLQAAGLTAYMYVGQRKDAGPLRRLAKRVASELDATERQRIAELPGIAGRIARRALESGVDPLTPGWASVAPVREAIADAGLDGKLLRWFRPDLPLADQVEAAIGRYVQAYGPVEDRIDVRGHISGQPGAPMIVRVGDAG